MADKPRKWKVKIRGQHGHHTLAEVETDRRTAKTLGKLLSLTLGRKVNVKDKK